MAADNDALMQRAMDAIEDSVRRAGPVQTINPRLLSVMGPPNPRWSGPSQTMWNAIFCNNLARVEALLREGAKPMTPTPGSSCALDMAVRMGHIDIIRLFHKSFQDVQEHGLRTLLTAIEVDDTEIVTLVLGMGMRTVFEQDEYMKCVFFGFACKHGTPHMLDTLVEHGPWFSWKAYKRWCNQLTEESRNDANKEKVAEIAADYMMKEESKRPWENPNDIPDSCLEDLDIVPLYKIMYHCCMVYPTLPIRTFYWEEFTSYKHPVGPRITFNYPPMGLFYH
ncbi:hypothetical protein BDV12DRAFT_194445 [Aspergillus spectabilis]